MANWGYRVYSFKLIAGQKKLAQEIPENREILLNGLGLVGEEIRVGTPHMRSPDTDEIDDEDYVETQFKNTDPTLSIRGSAFNQELSVIHTMIALGERGLHDVAIDPDDKTELLNLEQKSAETPRKVDFYFASSGFEGILVTEVVGMKDPVPLLKKWLRALSLEKRNQALDEINQHNEHFDAEGNKVTKSKVLEAAPKTISIQVERLADPELLRKIISDIRSMQAEYIELDENNKETEKRLVINVKEEKAKIGIANRILKASTSDGSIVKDTLEELDMSPEDLRSAKIEPDQVKARIQGEEASTTLMPGKLSDLFNYKFKQSGQPSLAPYYRTTLKKIDELKIPSRIAIEVPEDSELLEWIEREEASWVVAESPNKE